MNTNTGYNPEVSAQTNLPMMTFNDNKDNTNPPSYEEVMGIRKV